jgi:hypothetical protein
MTMATSCLLTGLLIGLPMGIAHAESPLVQLLDPDTISASTTSSSTAPSPTLGQTQPPQPPSADGADSGCSSGGVEIPCEKGGWWWNSEVNRYCHVWDLSADSPMWDQFRDAQGNPTGVYYECGDDVTLSINVCAFAFWADDRVATPPIPGSDPATVVRTAVDRLQLHPPTVGVGAYTYPKYEEWGLSWWVGAPMWLWVDATDPLQWGTHSLDAHLDGDGITATITATAASFDPGDGSDPVVCRTPGTPRPWNPRDPLADHSPTRCEHAYLETNTLGDIDSRYTVTATVTWQVTWSTTDGQYGQFDIEMASTSNPTIHVGQIHAVTVG